MTIINSATVLYSYDNGNCKVTLYDDGTKVRDYTGEPLPHFPESIDFKITSFCDGGCPHCHESSTKRGTHADFSAVADLLRYCPRGVEIAIGGGNAFAHPDIRKILLLMHHRGLVANITVNSMHLEQFDKLIRSLRKEKLFHALGISYNFMHEKEIDAISDDNTVIHLIAGIDFVKPLEDFFKKPRKILILGYKKYGFGKKFYKDGLNMDGQRVENNLAHWRYWIGTVMRHPNVTTCFDNLAIKQLGIKDWVRPETWGQCYMGDDGTFSMYIDAVKQEFAKSSTSKRFSTLKKSKYSDHDYVMSVDRMFRILRGEKEDW